MFGSEDDQNDLREPGIDADPGTSPEARSFASDDNPSSHDVPKAATRARKKLNLDEEDSNFVPKEILAKKQYKAMNTRESASATMNVDPPKKSFTKKADRK